MTFSLSFASLRLRGCCVKPLSGSLAAMSTFTFTLPVFVSLCLGGEMPG
jgi:hypothetical protein